MASKGIADSIAARKKLLKTPVKMMPDDPENIKRSKAEFIANRRKEKEEDAKVAEFRASLRAEKEVVKDIEKEPTDGVQEEGEKAEVTEIVKEAPVKRGRPKKVE